MNRKLFIFLSFISVVIFGVAGFLIWQRYAPIPDPNPGVYLQSASSSATFKLGIPVLNLDIPVYEGHLDNTKWEYSTIGVSHLSTTPWAGQPGNAVYYGHNWPNLLAELHLIKVGDQLVVTTASGEKKNFTVSNIEVVDSGRISILEPTLDTRLTLFTCTGFLDSKRLVVTAH